MGSPSRNVQYHPPRLSEDRLNLPQPHSPSLPTHCTAPGNRECAPERSRLGHDLGLGLVVLGVEDAALHAGLLERASQLFRLDDACGADQYRPTRTLNSGDLGHESLPFRRAVGEDDVLVVTAQARRVGRDHHDVEPVEFLEFFRRRLCRGGHTADSCAGSAVP